MLRLRVGRFVQVTWTWTLHCVTPSCVPRVPPSDVFHVFHFPPVRIGDVRAIRRQDAYGINASFPPVEVLSQVSPRRDALTSRRQAHQLALPAHAARRPRTGSRPASSSGSPSRSPASAVLAAVWLAGRWALRAAAATRTARQAVPGLQLERALALLLLGQRARRRDAAAQGVRTRGRRASARRARPVARSPASSPGRRARPRTKRSRRSPSTPASTCTRRRSGRMRGDAPSSAAAPTALADLPRPPRRRPSGRRSSGSRSSSHSRRHSAVRSCSRARPAAGAQPSSRRESSTGVVALDMSASDLRAAVRAGRDRRCAAIVDGEPVDRARHVLRHRLRAAAAQLARRARCWSSSGSSTRRASTRAARSSGSRPGTRSAPGRGSREGCAWARPRYSVPASRTARSSSSATSTTAPPTRSRSSPRPSRSRRHTSRCGSSPSSPLLPT